MQDSERCHSVEFKENYAAKWSALTKLFGVPQNTTWFAFLVNHISLQNSMIVA